jgi:hypothetical protein
MVEVFPDNTAPRWLLRDRDALYSDAFRRRVGEMGIREVIFESIQRVAESLRGETDRINPARMFGPRDHTW